MALALAIGIMALGCGGGSEHAAGPAGAADARGEFASSQVSDAIRDRAGDIQDCYEQEVLAEDASATGKVVVRFVVEPSGKVTDVRVTEHSEYPALDACVTSAVRTISFDRGPKGGAVTFSYPFVFAPRSERPDSKERPDDWEHGDAW